MRSLVDRLNEAINNGEFTPVLCIRLNSIDAKVIFYEWHDDYNDKMIYRNDVFPKNGTIDSTVSGEVAKIWNALMDCNGDGHCAADKLDRENDLYQIKSKDLNDMHHIKGVDAWYNKEGKYYQPWIDLDNRLNELKR